MAAAEDFLAKYRDIILLDNYETSRISTMAWLQKRLDRKTRLDQKLSDAMEKGMDNNGQDKEIKSLRWQIDEELQGIHIVYELLEASDMALKLFRETMLEALEMDMKKHMEYQSLKERNRFLMRALADSHDDINLFLEKDVTSLLKLLDMIQAKANPCANSDPTPCSK